MAAVLELDPEQLGCASDKGGGAYDRPRGSPLEVHPAAMRAACDLIDRLYQNGLLDLLRAIASSSGDLAAKLAEGADTGQTVRVIRNGITLLSILGHVDPAMLQTIANPGGKEERTAPKSRQQDDGEPPGLWALFRRLSNRDSRRGLALIAGAVESIGRAARQSDQRPCVKTPS